jgi:hypothetical protein
MAPPKHRRNMRTLPALDIRQFQRGRDSRNVWLTPDADFLWHWQHGGQSRGTIALTSDGGCAKLTYQTKQPDGSTRCIYADVGLSYTSCGLGGRRAWWVCSACGNRCAVLYFGANTFACRKCHHLSYPSQSETREDRALRAAGKIRRRLGWEPGVANPIGPRPKGMHQNTFWRHKAKYFAAARTAFGLIRMR